PLMTARSWQAMPRVRCWLSLASSRILQESQHEALAQTTQLCANGFAAPTGQASFFVTGEHTGDCFVADDPYRRHRYPAIGPACSARSIGIATADALPEARSHGRAKPGFGKAVANRLWQRD